MLDVRAVEIGDDGRDWVLVALGADMLSCQFLTCLAGYSVVTGRSLTRSK